MTPRSRRARKRAGASSNSKPPTNRCSAPTRRPRSFCGNESSTKRPSSTSWPMTYRPRPRHRGPGCTTLSKSATVGKQDLAFGQLVTALLGARPRRTTGSTAPLCVGFGREMGRRAGETTGEHPCQRATTSCLTRSASLLGSHPGWSLEPSTSPGGAPSWCLVIRGEVELSVRVSRGAVLVYFMDSDLEISVGDAEGLASWLTANEARFA